MRRSPFCPIPTKPNKAKSRGSAPLPPAVFLAYNLRRVDMAEPAAQPRTLADVLRQANSVGLWAQATRLLHDRLIAVSPEAAGLEPADALPDDGVGPGRQFRA